MVELNSPLVEECRIGKLQAAQHQHRNLGNMLEVLILDWSRTHEGVLSVPLRTTSRESTEPAADA